MILDMFNSPWCLLLCVILFIIIINKIINLNKPFDNKKYIEKFKEKDKKNVFKDDISTIVSYCVGIL
jgi:hypothetical protein